MDDLDDADDADDADDGFDQSLPPLPGAMVAARPDLQRLISDWGGYEKVPPEVWEKFDGEVRLWQQKIRLGDFRATPFHVKHRVKHPRGRQR